MNWSVKKRFWTDVTVETRDTGFVVALDGKALRTPAKAQQILPSVAVAEMVSDEWRTIEENIDPERMPVTRWANSAIDKVTPQFAEVAAMLASYGETDLLCYRADGPDALVAQQAEVWDPVVQWAEDRFDVAIRTTDGLLPVAQDAESVRRLSAEIQRLSAFELAAFHDLVTLSGSLILALAVRDENISARAAWRAAHLDEDWQNAQWGVDEEAEKMRANKYSTFSVSAQILGNLFQPGKIG